MIVEERCYTLRPGQVAGYLALYDAEGRAIQERILGHLIGFFHTDIGPLNQVVHLWGYDDFNERARRRAELWTDAGWLAFADKALPMIETMESKILIPAAFSPLR